MKSTISWPLPVTLNPSWAVLCLGVLVGLFAAVFPTSSLVLIVVASLVLVVLLIYIAWMPGLLELILFSVIAWFFLTESIIGSRIFHLDWSLSQLVVRLQGIVPGLTFGVVAVYLVLFRHHKWHVRLLAHELWLVIFSLFGLYSALIGLIRYNNPVYLIGDTFKYVFFLLAYLVVALVSKTVRTRIWVFEALVTLGIAYNIATLLIQNFNFLVLSKATLGRGMDFLSWIYLLLVLGHWRAFRRGGVNRWWFSLLAILVVFTGILSLERRDWLILVVSVLGVAWVSRYKVSTTLSLVLIIATLAVLVVILGLVFREQIYTLQNFVLRRVAFTFGSEAGLDPSSLRRFGEIKFATEYVMESGGIPNFFLGMGSGAQYFSPEAVPAHNIRSGAPEAGFLHQIHNTYFSVLFRMGVFALVILILFLTSLMSQTYRHLRFIRLHMASGHLQMERFLLTATLFLFLVITVMVAWNISYGIGDIQVAVALGLLGAELRDRKP